MAGAAAPFSTAQSLVYASAVYGGRASAVLAADQPAAATRQPAAHFLLQGFIASRQERGLLL